MGESMQLSKRLQKIADKVPPSVKVADIGTDHGYVPVYLIENKIAQTVIATDISSKSIKKAEVIIKNHRVEDKIYTRVGDGLLPLEIGEVDTVIIAGMGGVLIGNMLKDGLDIAEKIDTFILQPMMGQEKLRHYLLNNGFAIEDEVLVYEDKKFYEVMVARHGSQTVEDDIYYEIGYNLIVNHDPYLPKFIYKKMDKTKKLISHLEKQDTQTAKKRMDELKTRLLKYEEVYGWVQKFEI
jgi:tRNA (adenine22-N1)-methyltransferase